jgi:hypothetical protein
MADTDIVYEEARKRAKEILTKLEVRREQVLQNRERVLLQRLTWAQSPDLQRAVPEELREQFQSMTRQSEQRLTQIQEERTRGLGERMKKAHARLEAQPKTRPKRKQR